MHNILYNIGAPQELKPAQQLEQRPMLYEIDSE
jgi:hypothetical protein